MAADYIVINRTKQAGNNVVRLAELVREVRELCDKVNDNAGHCIDSGDYTLLESQFGLEAGMGANAATLLGLVQTIFNTDTDVAGASRLAQLDEFVARVAGQ